MNARQKPQSRARFNAHLAAWAWGVVGHRRKHEGAAAVAHSRRSRRRAAGPRPGLDDSTGGCPNRSRPAPELARDYFPQ